MASTKISQLTEKTTPAGTEELVVNDSGVSKKIKISNLPDNDTTYSVGDGGLTAINFTSAKDTKLTGIETGAEVNVQSDWNAVSGDAQILNKPNVQYTSAIPDATAIQTGLATSTQITKLDGIEAGADVTDTANVTSAGALMDSEVTNLAQVKAFDSSDYATAAHNHSGVYEPADATIVKDADIGSTVQAYDADTAKTDTLQTFTKSQIPSTETATISTSKTLDFDTYQNFILTLGSGANTLSNPTTEASNVGQSGMMVFIQPSSGSAGTVATGSDYETVGGAGLTLSSTNSAYDVVPYIIKADNSILLGNPQLAFS